MFLIREFGVLVICLITLSPAIRVDWNTNKGPIVPPPPRTTVQPQPPYREPAPVWEDQSDDIPNPNPYVYVLPSPSRPRPFNSNYFTSNPNNYNYGSIVTPEAARGYLQSGNSNVVPALSPQRVPNGGFKYSAVVPGNSISSSSHVKKTKYPYSTFGKGMVNGQYYGVNGGVNGGGSKLQGKFDAKTKKYKAYEKVKFVPIKYYPPFEFELPDEQPYVPTFNQEQIMETQQLPLLEVASPFRLNEELLRSDDTPLELSKDSKIEIIEIPAKSEDHEASTSATPKRR